MNPSSSDKGPTTLRTGAVLARGQGALEAHRLQALSAGSYCGGRPAVRCHAIVLACARSSAGLCLSSEVAWS
jgi:hypothetical protein